MELNLVGMTGFLKGFGLVALMVCRSVDLKEHWKAAYWVVEMVDRKAITMVALMVTSKV